MKVAFRGRGKETTAGWDDAMRCALPAGREFKHPTKGPNHERACRACQGSRRHSRGRIGGVSDKSWSDAAQQAVIRSSETMRHITGLDVLHSSAVVRDGKIIEYHVSVKVAFVVEPAEIET
jgi:flavin-binding protein dodecin